MSDTTGTPPTGQGGAAPHDGVAFQDQWPANPEPSEAAAEKGAENFEAYEASRAAFGAGGESSE